MSCEGAKTSSSFLEEKVGSSSRTLFGVFFVVVLFVWDAAQNAASEALNIFESLKYSREGLNNLAFNNKKDQPEKIEYIDGTESC